MINLETELKDAHLKNNFLAREVDRLRDRIRGIQQEVVRYNVLRTLEVVIMSPEGPRYLREDELDAYLDSITYPVGVQAEEVAQATPQAVSVSP